jgi:hypothetical protein
MKKCNTLGWRCNHVTDKEHHGQLIAGFVGRAILKAPRHAKNAPRK